MERTEFAPTHKSHGWPLVVSSDRAGRQSGWLKYLPKRDARYVAVVLGLSCWVPLPVTLVLHEWVGWNGTMRGSAKDAA